jgi:prenyltransferase beta subunit
MSLRLEMLQVARLAPRLLGESAALVAGFVNGQWNGDGGVRDRAGASDLYYTVFGLEALQALQLPPPATVSGYIAGFGSGDGLDLVHRCCLARAWSMLGMDEPKRRAALAASLAGLAARDGGFASRAQEAHGSAYAAFLALGALQDLGAPLPDEAKVLGALERLRATDGGYANQPGAATGSTPATVSAVMVQHAFGRMADPATTAWLLARQQLPAGGFLVHPQAPLCDLLSTATALHALACLEHELPAPRVEAALDFVDSLWTNQGSFHGHWAEEELDVEYTYYGLLTLGHLSL